MVSTGPRYFSADELEKFKGEDGSPTYIVFKGKVYDITGSQLWVDGMHMNIHHSREKLEETIKGAPHGEEVLSRFPVVGEYKDEGEEEPSTGPTRAPEPVSTPAVQAIQETGAPKGSGQPTNTHNNRDACICSKCPSYPLLCGGELLYCSSEVGKSRCDIKAMGCICTACPIYSGFGLSGLYFCDKDVVGREGVVMRKEGSREEDWFYQDVAEIKRVAYSGRSTVVSMGTKRRPLNLEDLHFMPAQVHRIPRLLEEPVKTEIVIGPKSRKPFRVSTPVLISGMSYGAVSKEVIRVISCAAPELKMAFNSGEGGVIPEQLDGRGYLIVQFSTGRFGITDEILKSGAAVEIRFGQGAYPGKGSYLPAEKITPEIAKIRGLKPGEAAYSPAHHMDMKTPREIKRKVEWLKNLTGGVPIGAKIGCGNVEEDVRILVECGVDYIALDGFGGATGATNTYVRENVGIPVIAALPKARRVLEELSARKEVTIIAGGGLRTSADFAKCLALGADAVYTATAALIAINCEQYRICHTGLCPTGVTAHDPSLTQLLDVAEGVRRLKNFIRVTTFEIANLTRIVGKNDVRDLDAGDLTSMSRDLSEITGVGWLGSRTG